MSVATTSLVWLASRLGVAEAVGTSVEVGLARFTIVGTSVAGMLVTAFVLVGTAVNGRLLGRAALGTIALGSGAALIGVGLSNSAVLLTGKGVVMLGTGTDTTEATASTLAVRVGWRGVDAIGLRVGLARCGEGVLSAIIVGLAGTAVGTTSVLLAVSRSTTTVPGMVPAPSDGLTKVRHRMINPDKAHNAAPIKRILILRCLSIYAPHCSAQPTMSSL